MSEIVYIDVHKLYQHPDNPRKNVDDLEELAASIKANGILQNLTVVPKLGEITGKWDGESYTVIIGHRRLAAAKLAGLEKVPCTVADMTPQEQVQTMLLENMQRKDLKVYEEAQGFQMLLDFGDSVEDVSKASGFSTTTIRRRVKLTELDQGKLKEAVDTRQIPLGEFEKLSELENVEDRNALLEYIGTNDFRWKLNEAMNRQEMNKNLPAIKAWLKSNHINKIPEGKAYNAEYTRLGDWNDFDAKDWEAALKKIPKLKPGKKYFYSIDERSCHLKLYLYEPVERTKRSPEEIAEEKRIAKAWEYMERKSDEMYQRRKAFIEGLTVTKKNECAVLHGAVLRTMAASFHYVYYDNSKYYELLGVPYDPNVYESKKWEDLFEAYWKNGKENLAKLIYLTWGDEKKQMPTSKSYRREWPEWSINKILTPLYDWLVSLGYEMTQEEKDLMTGKDKIYDKDSDVPDSEPVPPEEPEGDTEE